MNFKRFLSFKGIAIFALLSLLTILFLNYYKTQTFSLSSSTKTGMDTVTLSTTTVTQNGTINYVINVDNTGTIIEYPVLKDILATGTTLVKGSLKTSNGWTAKFSTNAGTSFVTNEPAANVNALEIKGVTIPANSPSISANAGASKIQVPVPIGSIATGGKGQDGFVPIVWENPVTSTPIYCEVFHHTSPAAINCQDGATGLNLPGFSKTLVVTGNASTYATPANNWHVMIGNKVYFGVQRNADTSKGILCWDMSTLSTCGFTQLSNTGRNVGTGQTFGVVQVGNLLYTSDFFAGDTGNKVYCFDTTTNAMCTAFTLAGFNSGVAAGTPIAMSYINGKLIVSGTSSTASNAIGCFTPNLTTGALTICSGTWPRPGGYDYGAAKAHYTTAGVIDGFCTFGAGVGNPTNKCYDFLGVDKTATMRPAFYVDFGSYEIGNDITVGSKVYYPAYGTVGSTVCWDYSINNYCVGFTDGGPGAKVGVRRWNQPNVGSTTVGKVGNTRDYGYTLYNNCGYGLGDAGLLWTYNLNDGKSPCSDADAKVSQKIDPTPPYCDGTPGPVLTAWDKLMPVGNAYPAGIGPVTVSIFTDNTYTVKIVGFDNVNVPAAGLDLSSLSIATYPQLYMQLKMPNTTGAGFDMVTTYQLNQPQKNIICFQAKVPNKCALDPIVNTVTVTDTDGTTSSANSMDVIDNLACPPRPSLKKNMVDKTSNSATDAVQGALIGNQLEAINSKTVITVDTITDPLAANQTYVNGTLSVPNGWTKYYSTDNGATFTTTEPASGVTNVKSVGQNLPYKGGGAFVVNEGVYGLTAPAVVGSSILGPSTLTLATNYCTGATAPTLDSWAKVMPTTGAYTGGSSATLTIFTDNTYTTPLAGFNNVNIPAAGLSIATVDKTLYPSLFYQINTSNPTGVAFDMSITYMLNGQEKYLTCFDARIADVCDLTSIANTATITNASAVNESATANLNITNKSLCLSSVGDFVWQDNNGNGIQDAGEPGVDDFDVSLMNAADDSTFATTETDATGHYLFTNVPSNSSYYLKFSTIPSNYVVSPMSVLTGGGTDVNNSDFDTATLSTDAKLLKSPLAYLDMGDLGLIPQPASVGNFIWGDTDKNGIQDTGETGFAGVTVTLKDPNGNTVGTPIVTDATGAYLFTNVFPRVGYYIELSTIPTGYILTGKSVTTTGSTLGNDSDVDGTTLKSDPFTLLSGADELEIDAGLYLSRAPTPHDDIYNTPVNTPIPLTPLDGDGDPDGDHVTLTGINGTPLTNTPNTTQVIIVPHGLVEITYDPSGTPTLRFIPDTNFVGLVDIPYDVTDGNGNTSTGHEAITVTPLPPAPVNDTITTTAGKDNPTNFTGNDKDPNGQKLKVTKVGNTDIDCSTAKTFDIPVTGGKVVVTCDANGNATFVTVITDPNVIHLDINYTVTNESGLSSTAVLGIDLEVNTIETKIYDPVKLPDPTKIPDSTVKADLLSLNDPYACGKDIFGYLKYTGNYDNVTISVNLINTLNGNIIILPITLDKTTGKYVAKVDYSHITNGMYKITYLVKDIYGTTSGGNYTTRITNVCKLGNTGEEVWWMGVWRMF